MNHFLSHLRLWQKFALIGCSALALALVASALLLQARYRVLDDAQKEQSGLAPAQAVVLLVQTSQQHRGLSSGVLSGNAGFVADRERKQTEVQQALDRASAAVATLGSSTGTPQLQALAQQIGTLWKPLAGAVAGRSIPPPESFRRHSEMIGLQLDLLYQVLDASALNRDPDAASYYLAVATLDQLPGLTEALGQARALGSAALTRKTLASEERAQIQAAATTARLQFDKARVLLLKAAAAHPAVQQQLQEPLARATRGAEDGIRLIAQQVLQPTDLAAVPQEYFAALTQAIDPQFALMAKGYELLHQMLDARVADARRFLVLFASALALTLALTVWVSVMTVRQSNRALQAALGAAHALSDGRLGHTVVVETHDEIGEMARTLARSMHTLSGTVQHIQQAIGAMHTASVEIATGTQDLSSRTEQQASALEETAASMDALGQTVRQNADSARTAHSMAREASAVAERGGSTVQLVVGSMRQIHDSSRRIEDITAVIDGIAFQTNILALNAAVEAARAGEHGRGFAVVASEVRALASRSAAAAREIKGLIQESVSRVAAGAQQADDAGDAMHGIVEAVQRVAAIMTEISAASAEQAQGIAQVVEAVSHMDRMTQQNAALVEQTAAASDSLRTQSDQVGQAMAHFR